MIGRPGQRSFSRVFRGLIPLLLLTGSAAAQSGNQGSSAGIATRERPGVCMAGNGAMLAAHGSLTWTLLNECFAYVRKPCQL